MLYTVLNRILVKPEVSESHNKNNAGYSILFEAISLIISFGNDAPESLRDLGEGRVVVCVRVREREKE